MRKLYGVLQFVSLAMKERSCLPLFWLWSPFAAVVVYCIMRYRTRDGPFSFILKDFLN